MAQKICPICNKPLPNFYNGNRRYHPECQTQRKKVTNAARYGRIKKLDNEALRLDKILSLHYSHSNGTDPIQKSILDALKFKWDFVTSISGNAPPVFWILEYGYSYSDNKKKITIHHGNNPL